MSNPRVKRSKNFSGAVPLVVCIAVMAVMSAGIAGVWQKAEMKNAEEPPFEPVKAGQESETPDLPEPPEEILPEPPAPIVTSYDFSKPMPEGERVRTEYFNDAVFVGDSITTGIEGYGVLPDSNVVATIGVNLTNIIDEKAYEVGPGNKITFLDAIDKVGPQKIYVMLGANGLAFLTPEQTVSYYEKFVDALISRNPDAVIYVQSILPIHEAKFATKYQGELTNAKIRETNSLLLEMAARKQIYYLDVAEVFKDSDGGLAGDATADGLHFNTAYYTKWIDYLKSHAAKAD